MSQAGNFCLHQAPSIFALAVLYADAALALHAIKSFKGGVARNETASPDARRARMDRAITINDPEFGLSLGYAVPAAPTNDPTQPLFTPADIPIALYSRIPHADLHALAKYQATM